MKRNSVLKMALATFLAAQVAVGAPGAIDFTKAPVIKNIKASKDNPVNLHQSTVDLAAIDHGNKFFTTRTMFRLGPAGLDATDQKLLRNEICGSNSVYESGLARALDIKNHPGSWGVYKKGRDIVSVADIGMAGKPLNQVLRELSKQPEADKVAIAKYFAVAMTRNLEVIHAGDVIWNNLDLSNFYVRPDGGTHAYDFTESKRAADPAAKDAEFNGLVNGPVLEMYRILFPIGDEAVGKFAGLVAQRPAQALIAAGGIPAGAAAAVRDELRRARAEYSAIAVADARVALGGAAAAVNNDVQAITAPALLGGAIPALAAEAAGAGAGSAPVAGLAARGAAAVPLASGADVAAAVKGAVEAHPIIAPLLNAGISLANVDAILAAAVDAAAAASVVVPLPADGNSTRAAAREAVVKEVAKLIQNGTTLDLNQAKFIEVLNGALPGARDAAEFNTKGLGPDGGGAADYANNAVAYLLNKPAAINVNAYGYSNVALFDQEGPAAPAVNGFYLDPSVLPLVPAPGVVHPDKAALCAGWTGL